MADIVGAESGTGGGAPGGLLAAPAVVPLDVVPFAMLVADASGRVLTVNRRWVALSGLDTAASLGLGWLAVLGPEDRIALHAAVRQVGSGGPGRRLEHVWAGTGGRRATWWLASHEWAGQKLVGLAVAEPVGPAVSAARTPAAGGIPGPSAEDRDRVLAEVPGLLQSVAALLDTLDRLVERLSRLEAVPA